jgi:hypothetical protein
MLIKSNLIRIFEVTNCFQEAPVMLIYSFFNAAMIPTWIMSTKAMKAVQV